MREAVGRKRGGGEEAMGVGRSDVETGLGIKDAGLTMRDEEVMG